MSFLRMAADALQPSTVFAAKRADWLNRRIQDAYRSYSTNLAAHGTQANLLEHQMIVEEVIYWMRKNADEPARRQHWGGIGYS